MNLASSFVNGFVNAAFGQDKLLTDDGNKWLYKNKDHGKGTLAHAAILEICHQSSRSSFFRCLFHISDCPASKDGVNVHRDAERCSLPGYDPPVGRGWWVDSDRQIPLFL